MNSALYSGPSGLGGRVYFRRWSGRGLERGRLVRVLAEVVSLCYYIDREDTLWLSQPIGEFNGGGGKGGVRMECNVNKLYPIDWGVEILFLRESGQAPVVTTTWPNADLTVVEYSVNSMYTFISVELLCTSS